MKRHRIATGLTVIAGAGAAIAYGALFRLPHFFPYSDVVILASLGGILSILPDMVFPDSLLHDPQVRLRHAFVQRHKVSQDRAEIALKAIERIQNHCDRLNAARENLSSELDEQIQNLTANLQDIAKLLFYEPQHLPTYQKVIIRSESAVEVAEGQSRLRKTKASEAEIVLYRAKVADSLNALQSALDHTEQRRINTILSDIDVSSSIAETLLQSPKRK